MSCACGDIHDVQQIPTDKGVSLDRLHQLLGKDADEAIIHFYVASTFGIEQRAGRECMTHSGSGPNFAGSHFTLCTCKHDLRTVHKPEDWVGHWVAGFSGVSKNTERKQYLLYLMRVGQAYKTHQELWDSLDEKSRQLKNAAENKFGDLFEPLQKDASTNPMHYRSPITNHVHSCGDSWKEDIDFQRNGKSAALLVSDAENSFCWSTPSLYIDVGNKQVGRQRYARRESLASFMGLLKT